MKRNIENKIKRQQQVEAGAYDGRYKSRIVPNKKKKQNKEQSRKWKYKEM